MSSANTLTETKSIAKSNGIAAFKPGTVGETMRSVQTDDTDYDDYYHDAAVRLLLSIIFQTTTKEETAWFMAPFSCFHKGQIPVDYMVDSLKVAGSEYPTSAYAIRAYLCLQSPDNR